MIRDKNRKITHAFYMLRIKMHAYLFATRIMVIKECSKSGVI